MHLSDCFVDLIAFVAYGTRHPDVLPDSCEDLKRILETLIRTGENRFLEEGFSQTDYDLARFAVLVWADETLMKSSWKGKGQWSQHLLQKAYFKTSGGGVEFYRKLETLDADQGAAREVFALCLALGYSGRYSFAGEDRVTRDRIKARTLRQLTGSNEALATLALRNRLFPEAYERDDDSPETGKKRRFPSLSSVFLTVFPLGVLGFLYALYRFILNHELTSTLGQ
jgi:type VI secretion system protein ImpK